MIYNVADIKTYDNLILKVDYGPFMHTYQVTVYNQLYKSHGIRVVQILLEHHLSSPVYSFMIHNFQDYKPLFACMHRSPTFRDPIDQAFVRRLWPYFCPNEPFDIADVDGEDCVEQVGYAAVLMAYFYFWDRFGTSEVQIAR